MVRINSRHFHEAYEYIKEDAADGNSTCLIFVAATDVDSLCAVHLLQSILKSDFVQHKIVPVSDPQDLIDANEKLIAGDDELRSVIMINCGGTEDVTSLLQLNPVAKVYVIDSHRPLSLDNLTPENDHVCVFTDNDEYQLGKYIDAFKRLEALNSVDSLASGDEDDWDEDEDGRSRNNRPTKRRRHHHRDQIALSSNQRNERRRLQLLLAEYFASGYYHANSVAGTMFALAQQLGKSNNDLLWLAIVGVTSQYIFERIDTARYNAYVREFRIERTRLNVDRPEVLGLLPGSQPQTYVDYSIQAEDEYRFVMFRHWSLFDSMYYSGYIATKLAVWRDDGKRRLQHMFAKMGFSIQQCQQIFTHMDMDLKQQLKEKIAAVAPLYGLTDICFPSFTRSYGYECCLSATDMVYALSTLLETSPTAVARLKGTVDWNYGRSQWGLDKQQPPTEDATTEAATEGDTPDIKSNRRHWWMHNFYIAYDALTGSSPDNIKQGLQLCMKTQKKIVDQGTNLFDRSGVKTCGKYRAVTLEPHIPDIEIFQHPSSVRKLALFITDAFREHGKRNLPLLVAAADEVENTSLILGLSSAAIFGEIRKNQLGLAFAEAAEKSNTKMLQASFDIEVLQMQNDDIVPFVRAIKLVEK